LKEQSMSIQPKINSRLVLVSGAVLLAAFAAGGQAKDDSSAGRSAFGRRFCERN
jgi:hypothetical protein